MAFDISCFATLTPSRYLTFTIPYSYGDSSNPRPLRVAVLDSPLDHGGGPPRVAAILVPENREGDWIFCTETGHLQLLSDTPDVSRLILAGREPSDGGDGPSALGQRCPGESKNPLEETVGPLLSALSPKICFHSGVPVLPILSYEDDLISSVTIEICAGDYIGEMLIEDVELDCGGQESEEREFRRRLRFRRTPNLVQTQVRIVPESDVGADIGKARFRIDSRVLVHPYLAPMVASLSLVSPHIDDRFRTGLRPRALCLGVGGGALFSFLKGQLGFEVLGLEIDAEVTRVARKYFGLEEDSEMVRIIHGDAIEFVKKVSGKTVKGNSVSSDRNNSNGAYGVGTLFDAIMVDLDSADVTNGLSAPPLEFLEKCVLVALKSILCESGILAVNVIPSNRPFYEMLLGRFREVFCELYEIDVGNIVLIATVASIAEGSGVQGSSFRAKLKTVIPGAYIESIEKI